MDISASPEVFSDELEFSGGVSADDEEPPDEPPEELSVLDDGSCLLEDSSFLDEDSSFLEEDSSFLEEDSSFEEDSLLLEEAVPSPSFVIFGSAGRSVKS